jgi:hypothetical protein
MGIRFSPADCQGNYAAAVRGITPFGFNPGRAVTTRFCHGGGSYDSHLRQKTRREAIRAGIIELAVHRDGPGGTHDRHHRCEVCCPAATWRPQSPSRACGRFRVSSLRVLRPARSRSGQVRDAAAGPPRRALGHGGIRGFRLFAVRVLRSQGGISARGIAGPDPSPVRTSTPAQADRTDSGVSPRTASPRSDDGRGDTRTTGSRRVWRKCSSSQHRTGAGSSAKKGATLPIAECSRELWTARYEDLRKRALTHDAADSDAGWEQALVIRQGLPAWMNAWPQLHSPRPPTSAPTNRTDPDLALAAPQQSQLAHILASIILHSRPEVPS